MTKTVSKIKLNGAWFYNLGKNEVNGPFKSYKADQTYSVETMRVMWSACDADKRQIVWRA